MQIGFNDAAFATARVAIHGTDIRKDLIIAADSDTGRVWCWQVDGRGHRLNTVELKTGEVTIELPDDGQ